MKTPHILLASCLSILLQSRCLLAQTGHAESGTTWVVPLGGNAWSSSPIDSGGRVTDSGIQAWTDSQTVFFVYFRVSQPGMLYLKIPLTVPSGSSVIQVSALGRTYQIHAQEGSPQIGEVGPWKIPDSGYVRFTLKGLSKTGSGFGSIQEFRVKSPDKDMRLSYVSTNTGNYFYWGRRGPSVHLRYLLPDSAHARYFYNEVTVPKGKDVQGSYFMADGFAQGYFGMQVNGPHTRHVLFSVWSPFQTDNPKAIPDSLRIRLLRKGPGVHAGAFGNEGSGGQSYLNYPWKAGHTYRFLVEAQPDTGNTTRFTAWFYAPESHHWRLIASFLRPETHSYLKHLYSFLENFDPAYGNLNRMAYYANAWIYAQHHQWIPLNRIEFTGDPTAQLGYRMDYGGGLHHGAFYLTNGGFFSRYTPLNQNFTRKSSNSNGPDVHVQALP